jgi:SAM-dependent methyltransferase
MADAADRHQEQISYWNNAGGARWASAQEHMDKMLAPVSQLLLGHARAVPGMAALDIGCGGGGTTLGLAKAVGPAGRVVGVDVSEQLIGCARARLSGLSHVQFVHADAASHAFTPFADLAISRFGVMFFGDPAAAFANIRKAIKPDGRLVFACWRALDENPWMKVQLKAVYSAGAPAPARPGPEEPGPFSFADPERVKRILTAAGFRDLALTSKDISLDIAAGAGLAAAVQQAITIGAAAAALRDQPEDLRDAAAGLIEKAFAPYAAGGSVSLPGSIWLVEARV